MQHPEQHPAAARHRARPAERSVMALYRATLTFSLPTGDEIDAVTAATLLGERLFSEQPEFHITGISVVEAD